MVFNSSGTCTHVYTRTALLEFARRNGTKKRDTAILIDRAEFATRRDSIVCLGKILKASTELSRYRARPIGSIFRAEHANSVH